MFEWREHLARICLQLKQALDPRTLAGLGLVAALFAIAATAGWYHGPGGAARECEALLEVSVGSRLPAAPELDDIRMLVGGSYRVTGSLETTEGFRTFTCHAWREPAGWESGLRLDKALPVVSQPDRPPDDSHTHRPRFAPVPRGARPHVVWAGRSGGTQVMAAAPSNAGRREAAFLF